MHDLDMHATLLADFDRFRHRLDHFVRFVA